MNAPVNHIAEACEDVLGTMFFTGILGPASFPLAAESAIISAQVCFEGPSDGALQIRMLHTTARALASSFLGAAPEDVTMSQCSQVACEMVNMLCGSVLSRSAPSSVFRLSSPVLDDNLPAARGRDSSARFELPEGVLCVFLRVLSDEG